MTHDVGHPYTLSAAKGLAVTPDGHASAQPRVWLEGQILRFAQDDRAVRILRFAQDDRAVLFLPRSGPPGLMCGLG